jgi:hypothetical protein
LLHCIIIRESANCGTANRKLKLIVEGFHAWKLGWWKAEAPVAPCIPHINVWNIEWNSQHSSMINDPILWSNCHRALMEPSRFA